MSKDPPNQKMVVKTFFLWRCSIIQNNIRKIKRLYKYIQLNKIQLRKKKEIISTNLY